MKKYLNSILGYLAGSKARTANQQTETGYRYGSLLYNRKRPVFTRILAQAMLADPHVQFGLYLIKGPILSGSRFFIQCDDASQKKFLVEQITRFWTRYAKYGLRSLHYGWYGAEVMYRLQEGLLHFDALVNLDPNSVRPHIKDGGLTGMSVRINSAEGDIYLPIPKSFWTVHAREANRWWGQSRLYGAHIPWFEYNAPEGFRDSRRLFFYKNAFDGGVIRFPWGVTVTPQGDRIDNRDLANQLLDMHRNGSGLAIPHSPDETKNWDWERPQSQDISASYTEYGHDLRDEIWEGLGVPPEIAKAQGTGAYAGRQIPQEAFYSLLQEIVQDLMTDFDEQVLRPLCALNFGDGHCRYDIECFGLLRSLEDDRGNHKDDARQPLGVRDGGDQTKDPPLSQRSTNSAINMSEICVDRAALTDYMTRYGEPAWAFRICDK